jgi:pimeloyl-ACP methyl ester carboxylesterase
MAEHTVVFLHGLCLNQASWDRQIGYVLGRYGRSVRVISYDHRGHGGSAAAPMSTYRIEQLADDLARVLTVLDVTGPVTLVGHSMGGMTALAYLGRPAAERPVEVAGLVLIATAAGKLAERGFARLLATPAPAALVGLVEHTPAYALHALGGSGVRDVEPLAWTGAQRNSGGDFSRCVDHHTGGHRGGVFARSAGLQPLRHVGVDSGSDGRDQWWG